MAQLVSNQPLYMKEFITEKEEQELLEHFQSQWLEYSMSHTSPCISKPCLPWLIEP